MAKYSYLDSAFRSLTTILISFITGDNKEKDEAKDTLYTPDSKHQILCNNTRTLKEFKTNQDKYFRSFRTLLESEINEYQTKGEYLFLLNNFSTELRSIKNLINSESLSGSPAYLLGLIKFTDMPEGYGMLLPLAEVDYKTLPLNIFSEHIKNFSIILNEAETYITCLTAIITATASSDLPLKPNIPPKPDVSTLEDPLKFFNHFIFNDGFVRFENKFFTIEYGLGNAYSELLHTNKTEGYREYLVYNESGLPDNVKKVFFKDELKNLLDRQYAISIEFLDQLVSNNQADSNKLSSILNFHLSNSLGLTDAIKKGPKFGNYIYILDRLDTYTKRIVDKYSLYLDKALCNMVDPKKFEIPLIEKLTWNGDGDTFAQFFKKSILDGKITFNDGKSFDPVFKKLASFFNVKFKLRDSTTHASGYLKESSVIEKFKIIVKSKSRPSK
jgi:hypothetical protein